jgi:hypothetical protein
MTYFQSNTTVKSDKNDNILLPTLESSTEDFSVDAATTSATHNNSQEPTTTIEKRIQEMQTKLDYLERELKHFPIITVIGVKNLKKESGKNWEDRLSYLMFKAHIPLSWILETVPEIGDPVNPDTVYVSFISLPVKNRVLTLLNEYLTKKYNNIVYIA